jgi:hypothetical protein
VQRPVRDDLAAERLDHRVGHARAPEHLLAETVRAAEHPLGQHRQLEQQHVERLQGLRAAAQRSHERGWMRDRHRRQRPHRLGVGACDRPGHRGAPVVADQVDGLADLVDQRLDVRDELADPVPES